MEVSVLLALEPIGSPAKMDFSRMKKDQLVIYLKKRDFPTSNMRKAELEALCERVYRLDLPVIIEDDDSAQALSNFLTTNNVNKIVVPKTLKPDLKGKCFEHTHVYLFGLNVTSVRIRLSQTLCFF